jgi:hypothetical protein
VVAKLRKRSKKGQEEYGTTMVENNGSQGYWLDHLQEELMDSIIYIEKLKDIMKKFEKMKEIH